MLVPRPCNERILLNYVFFFFYIKTAQVISVVGYDIYLFIKLLITRKLPVIAQIFLPVFACCQRSASDFLQQTEASVWIQRDLHSANKRKMLQLSGVILWLFGQSQSVA